jgi:hypothetical protein
MQNRRATYPVVAARKIATIRMILSESDAMNTANPQLEGLYLALSALVRQMITKGVLSQEDLDAAMAQAREQAEADFASSPLPDANRKAVLFPIELLALAGKGEAETFRALARRVALGT